MPNFADPFTGNTPKAMSRSELARSILLDIASETEAIFLYDAHAEASTDEFAKKVLRDIRDEEKKHVGELLALLNYLQPDFEKLLADGEGEVLAMARTMGLKKKV